MRGNAVVFSIGYWRAALDSRLVSACATRRLRRRWRAPKSLLDKRIARTRRARKRHPRADQRGERRTNAAHALESLERAERAILVTILDDAMSEHGTDAWELLDL